MKRANDFPKIFLFNGAADMRKQAMGLAALVENELKMSPFQNALFIFCNRSHDIMKALYFDKAGFCLWTKKLDQSRFPWLKPAQPGMSVTISAADFELLIDGVDVFKRHKKLEFESLY